LAATGQKPTDSIEIIEWMDAVAYAGWDHEDGGAKPAHIVSVGKLVADTKQFVTLAGTFGKNDRETNARICIPKGWIVKRKTVKF
jgi:hypothetical protein